MLFWFAILASLIAIPIAFGFFEIHQWDGVSGSPGAPKEELALVCSVVIPAGFWVFYCISRVQDEMAITKAKQKKTGKSKRRGA